MIAFHVIIKLYFIAMYHVSRANNNKIVRFNELSNSFKHTNRTRKPISDFFYYSIGKFGWRWVMVLKTLPIATGAEPNWPYRVHQYYNNKNHRLTLASSVRLAGSWPKIGSWNFVPVAAD